MPCGYGAAAAQGRPDAVQVADRWHLMENASAAFLVAVKRRTREVRRAFGQDAVEPATLTAAERIQYEGWRRRVAEEETIRALHAEGVGVKKIDHRPVAQAGARCGPGRPHRTVPSARQHPRALACR